MYEYGLGKSRSKLGKFLDKNNIKQNEIIKLTGFTRTQMQRLCSSEDWNHQRDTKRRIVGALVKLGYEVSESDFW